MFPLLLIIGVLVSLQYSSGDLLEATDRERLLSALNSIEELRIRLAAVEERLAQVGNVYLQLRVPGENSSPVNDSAASLLRYAFDESFVELSRERHACESPSNGGCDPPAAVNYVELPIRSFPFADDSALNYSSPGPMTVRNALVSVWADGSASVKDGGGREFSLKVTTTSIDSPEAWDALDSESKNGDHGANQLAPGTLCPHSRACHIMVAAGGKLPNAVLLTGNVAAATVSLWSIAFELPAGLGPPITVSAEEICTTEPLPPGHLPSSLLLWTMGVGAASNRFFVGSTAGAVFHFYRNCTLRATHAVAREDGAAAVVALARQGYVLAAGVGSIVRFVQLDSQRIWAAMCRFGSSTFDHSTNIGVTVTSIAYEPSSPSMLWIGLSDGSVAIAVTRFADPAAQMSSTCLVSRRFPPIFCARRSGAVCAESAITASAGDNNASVALAWVERPLAAAVVLLREYAIIGNSYGLAIYSMPKITASHPKLLMAAPFNGASSSSEDRVRQISTSLCTASTSDVANNGVCATALSSSVLVPSLRLAVSGSVRPAAGAKHADRSGSDGTQIAAVLPVVQPAAAVASSESSGFPGVLTWQSSTLLCLMRQADPPASHEGFWSSVLGGSARIPVALVGLVVGVGFQIWRRSQRLYRDRLAAAPRQSDDDDVPWPGPDHAVMAWEGNGHLSKNKGTGASQSPAAEA
jgi:hypothetical protein